MPQQTLEERLARVESALASSLNLNLSAFDPQDVLALRAEKLAAAGDQAADLVRQAFTEEPLTIDQRLERIEVALRSGGRLA